MFQDFANALKGGDGDNFAYLFRITPFLCVFPHVFPEKFLNLATSEGVKEAKVFKKTIQYLSEFGALEGQR